jgi:hypothetical protein
MTRYQENKARVKEIYGVEDEDGVNVHHICDRANAKKGKFGKDFDVNDKSNLIPLKVEDHDALHRRIQELEGQIEKEGRKGSKRRR